MKLTDFLKQSPVNFLAVDTIARRLEECGYTRRDARESMKDVKSGDKFFVTKNDSSIYAFHIGKKTIADAGFRLICAHCDSPTFRIKPNAQMNGDGDVIRLNTEVYGGPILSTWMDRPLSLAGRVVLRTDNPLEPETRLLFVKRPLLTIPNLAIHFNRQVNDGVKLSKQKDMLPILGVFTNELEKNNALITIIIKELSSDTQTIASTDILDFDLYLYDTTEPSIIGLHEEYVQSGRLDDLSMVHAGLEALVAADSDTDCDVTRVLAIFDNEETGSQTKQGAGSPFLANIICRINETQNGTIDDYYRAVEKAFMISADNAHAWHPNYSEKYDPTNHPVMGGGPVIKYNAAQKYASDSVSAAVFMEICNKAGVPYQTFVNHSDVAGGSTLGNILASSLPVRGVDMGNPIWAMHSARETGSVLDHEYCIKAFTEFYKH